jgi:hypothetical protein
LAAGGALQLAQRIAVDARSGDSFEFDAPEILLHHNSDATAPLPN